MTRESHPEVTEDRWLEEGIMELAGAKPAAPDPQAQEAPVGA